MAEGVLRAAVDLWGGYKAHEAEHKGVQSRRWRKDSM